MIHTKKNKYVEPSIATMIEYQNPKIYIVSYNEAQDWL